ncbi:MAG TPA: DUF2911 domain-containing protein [Longimicrobiales bacterium]|nr:DUF2911 domain-containing protein [Longimicrobiales bacterium]
MTPLSRRLSLLLFIAMAPVACADSGTSAVDDRAAYLTLLGEDTLVVEWVEFGEGRVEASALIRGSRTTWSEYMLEMDEAGMVTGWEARTWAGGEPSDDLLRYEYLEQTDSGAMLVTSSAGEQAFATRSRPFEAEAGAVPFIDFLHWPFEVAFRQDAAGGTLGQAVETFGGTTFEMEANASGSYELIHPSRGPSTVEISDDGRILALDGTGSTRAYDLRRMGFEELDRDVIGAAFEDRPLGELSGRGEVGTTVAGVTFTGDYGTPERRGRAIFGDLVAYGERWRTGANRATHLSFDSDIVIDGTTIPAGDYTLYSIPEAEGGTLIINRMTGQTGTRYDESMDEARVDLRRDALDENVEVFEIRVFENDAGDGGRIEFRWAETVYFVPFTTG